MSNFSAFKREYLKALIEPFLPGATDNVTPIKFEAITPDIFAFLFRTTDKNNQSHFFVALEFDYVSDIEEARSIITRWQGSFQVFLAPANSSQDATSLDEIRVAMGKSYYVILAKVEAPQPPSYWCDAVTLLPNMSVESVLGSFPESQRSVIKKNLEAIRHSHPKVTISIYLDDSNLVNFYYN